MRAVARKDRGHFSNPTIGYLTPVFVEKDDEWVRVRDLKREFPNNECIFVYRGYEAINDKYIPHELFIVSCDLNPTHNPEQDSSSMWTSTGDRATEPVNNEFCRILESSRPLDPTQDYWIWQEENPLNDVFIRAGEHLYGPFNYSSKTIENEDGVNLLLRAEAGHDYCIYKIKTAEAEKYRHVYQDGTFHYLIGVTALLDDKRVIREAIYYGTPADLLEWAKNVTDASVVGDVRRLGKALGAVQSLSRTEQARLDRLQALLGNAEEWFSQRLPAFIARYLEENSIGKQKLDDYLRINEQNEPERDAELKRLREEVARDHNGQSGGGDYRLAELPESERQLMERLLDDAQLRQQFLQADGIDNQIRKMEMDREIKKRLIEESDKALKQKQDLQDGLEKSLRKLKASFSDTEEVRSKFFEVKPYVDWINGIVPTGTDSGESEQVRRAVDALKIKSSVQPLREYLGEVSENLNRLDRRVEYNDLANYLITINQNFLTVFAGLPGVGKTSLTTKLAAAAGLQDRFLPISTARGWTSQRDFIGYHNAISNQFQQARTGLYNVLKICDSAVRQDLDVPYWVLLDEANLSPLEHYWSDFMRFTDPESERVLRIPGGDGLEELHLGQGLRFVATINYDHTTEPLSPRLLDRVAVVRLTAPKEIVAAGKPGTLPPPDDYYSAAQLEQMLNPADADYEMPGNALKLLNEIRELLENEEDGLPIVINPRKQRDVSKYCAVAQQVFEDNGNAFEALDYAVAQQILPLIGGRGEKFGKRLNALYDLINQFLPDSSVSLRRIIRNGDSNYYNYRFFA